MPKTRRPKAEELDDTLPPLKPDKRIETTRKGKPESQEDRERARQRSGEDD